jgi:hypothetical protein
LTASKKQLCPTRDGMWALDSPYFTEWPLADE